MGINNRQRRAAKAKRRGERTAHRASSHHDPHTGSTRPTHDDARALLTIAADASFLGDDATERRAVHLLAAIEPSAVAHEAEMALLSAVALLWRNGWQPAEVVRLARRRDAKAGQLAAMAVAADHAVRAPSGLSAPWAAQLAALDLPAVAGNVGWLLPAWAGPGRVEAIALVVRVLGALRGVGPLPTIIPPPGAPPEQRVADRRRASDDPVLVKVRALLAQAESTTFEAEAEAFTAKAQELMARHAIDAALVRAETASDERPVTIRVPIDDPYADIKSLLLQYVAKHARCSTVYHGEYALSSVVGFASDVAAAETMYTSLLLQSHASLRAEAAAAPPGGRARSRGFRSSFLMAFVQRIHERLAEVTAHVEAAAVATAGPALLPALRARDSAVDDTVAAHFGQLRSTPIRGGTDAAGWARGRIAADQAQLHAGAVEG